jgi:Peptidase A4 family
MSNIRRLLAGGAAAAALALAGLPAAGASAAATATRPALPTRVLHVRVGSEMATFKIRGDWKMVTARLPREHLPRPKIIRSATARANGSASSGNWSGYVDIANKGVAIRYVTSDFNIPNLNCANSTNGTNGQNWFSSWTGLDGWTDGTVEQQGIEDTCNGGSATLYVFYEMYPANPVVFTGAGFGDALQSSTYYNTSTGDYTLDVTDLTQSGAGVTETIKCAGTCHNSSAEVISEAPGGGPPTYGLTDYGAENYTSSGVTSRSGTKGTLTGNSLWSSDSITMVNSSDSHTLSTVGALQGNVAFLAKWVAST